ncbi:MAG: phosphatase PAP2 family protein [Proteobacteria bacterium]|nr:phosphatase PAP2 family protein [Pseudomonadota bacterium]
MQSIIKFDHTLFTLFNSTLKAGFLDVLMPFITEDLNLFIIIVLILAGLFGLYRRRDTSGLFTLILLIIISDGLVQRLKELIGRARPCISIESAELLVGCSSSYSLPSGHATNIFAAMLFISLRYPKLAPVLMAFACIVAYSRVYVGVHYPVDVAAGALLGSTFAIAATYIEKYFVKMRQARRVGVQ